MREIPNLSYVSEIAGDDCDFAEQFIDLFKEEFRWEVGMYLRYIKNREPRQASEMVAKSKYKLRILGLERAFIFAEYYEQLLQQGDTSLDHEFRGILKNVNSFLTKV